MMQNESHIPIVFTIGHSTHTLERFVDLLQQHKVTAVADVRSIPYSRMQPQFNREALMNALKGQGIGYVFLGQELGVRSNNRTLYENGRVQYRRLAKTELFQAGLERVQMGSKKHQIALMCAEREPLECHRTILISRELEAQDARVVHIHADGHLEPHADAINRLLLVLGLFERNLFCSQEELIEEAYEKQEARIAYVDERLVSSPDEVEL
jgi:uncharacterized protein (DUF488 family)